MVEKPWVDERLEDPEFREHFIEELSKQYREEIAALRADRRRLIEATREACIKAIAEYSSVEGTAPGLFIAVLQALDLSEVGE